MKVNSLHMTNFMSHPETNLDFRDINLALISGPNGNGKSSIIEAIFWALYGTARVATDETCRQGATDMLVEMTFDLGGKTYRITRSWTAKNGGKPNCLFEQQDAQKWLNLSGGGIRETNATIAKTLNMDLETLEFSAVMKQGKADQFAASDPAKRKDVLFAILGIGMYGDIDETIRIEIKGLKDEVDRTTETIISKQESICDESQWQTRLEESHEEARECEEAIAELQGTLAGIERDYNDKRARESALGEVAKQRESTRIRIASRGKEMQSLQGDISQIQQQLSGRDRYTEKATQLLPAQHALDAFLEVKTRVLTLKSEESDQRQAAMVTERQRDNAISVAERSYTELKRKHENQIANICSQITNLTPQVEALAGLPCAETDMQNSCKLLRAGLSAKEQLPKLNESLEICKKLLENIEASEEALNLEDAKKSKDIPNGNLTRANALRKELEGIVFDPNGEGALRTAVMESTKASQALAELEKLGSKLESINSTIQDRQIQNESDEEAIKALDVQLQELETLTPLIRDAQDALAQTRETIDSLRADQTQAKQGEATAEAHLQNIAKIKAEIEQMRDGIKAKSEQLQGLADVDAAFGKKGVPALLIERNLPVLEDEANRILSKISDGMSIDFVTQAAKKSGEGVKETLDIVISDHVGTRRYEAFSGGEQFRINFALRVALAKLLAHRAGVRIETLVIDEGFGSLDPEGVQLVMGCIQGITDEFGLILVISHVEALKEAFPVQIVVSKGENGSVTEIIG